MTVYAGKFLRVDLTEGTWHDESINEEQVEKWLLGSGVAAKLLHDGMDPSLDPLDLASPLLVFNGVLTGTFAPAGCRSSWCGRSPATGIWNESNVGGYWGAELRFTGYDGLVITGQAEKPVYLWINGLDNTIELRDASHLWSKDYFETADTLLSETDPRAQVAGIGPAGENLVKMAGIMTGPSQYVRAAGRAGMGALLGSKKLKAIVVRGNQQPQYLDQKALRDKVKSLIADIEEKTVTLSNYGTAAGMVAIEAFGDLPVRNWTLGSWDEAEKVSGRTIYDKYLVKDTHCYACPIGCGKRVEVLEGKYQTPRGEGVEYEAIAGFAAMIGNANAESVILASSLCNRYGLDTISTSAVIGFAMEAYERGLIGRHDTGGVELRFGDPDAMIAMIEAIGYRRDIGDVLAEGVREAARRIGDKAQEFAMHVKGLEIPYHDPRAFVSMAVNYATANRGACHLEGVSYWNGYGVHHPDLGYPETLPHHDSTLEQVKLVYDYQNYMSVFNPLGLCKFIAKAVGPEQIAQLVNSALGWDWTVENVLTMGKRLFQLKRLVNLRLGVTAGDDTLPKRLLTEPRPTGGAAGVLPDLDVMLPLYYQLRDWDETGAPRQRRLEQLDLT